MSVYLPSTEWDRLLAPGRAALRLVPYRDELWLQEKSTGQLVNVANRHLPALGIWTGQVRGLGYYAEAATATGTEPGRGLTLTQEVDLHDPHAIAVRASGQVVGHVNRQMAARLSALLPLAAVSLAGSPAGTMPSRVRFLAAEPGTLATLGVAV